MLSHLFFPITLQKSYFHNHLHFIDEKSEIQVKKVYQGQIACKRQHWDCNPSSVALESTLLFSKLTSCLQYAIVATQLYIFYSIHAPECTHYKCIILWVLASAYTHVITTQLTFFTKTYYRSSYFPPAHPLQKLQCLAAMLAPRATVKAFRTVAQGPEHSMSSPLGSQNAEFRRTQEL
jgi:hypothetical protein